MPDRENSAIIAGAFPSEIARIDALRVVDPAFDELCVDYVALATLAGSKASPNDVMDVLESLEGLQHDIRAALNTQEQRMKETDK